MKDLRYFAEVALGIIVASAIGLAVKRLDDRRIALAVEDEKWKRESESLHNHTNQE